MHLNKNAGKFAPEIVCMLMSKKIETKNKMCLCPMVEVPFPALLTNQNGSSSSSAGAVSFDLPFVPQNETLSAKI